MMSNPLFRPPGVFFFICFCLFTNATISVPTTSTSNRYGAQLMCYVGWAPRYVVFFSFVYQQLTLFLGVTLQIMLMQPFRHNHNTPLRPLPPTTSLIWPPQPPIHLCLTTMSTNRSRAQKKRLWLINRWKSKKRMKMQKVMMELNVLVLEFFLLFDFSICYYLCTLYSKLW